MFSIYPCSLTILSTVEIKLSSYSLLFHLNLSHARFSKSKLGFIQLKSSLLYLMTGVGPFISGILVHK